MKIFLFFFKLYYLSGWLGDKVKMKFYNACRLCCCGLMDSHNEVENNGTNSTLSLFCYGCIGLDVNRRHNKDTHHTAIIQLAFAGTIAGFDIDTSFFDGSHPSYASVEGCLIVKGVKDSYEVRFSAYGTECVCPAAFLRYYTSRLPSVRFTNGHHIAHGSITLIVEGDFAKGPIERKLSSLLRNPGF